MDKGCSLLRYSDHGRLRRSAVMLPTRSARKNVFARKPLLMRRRMLPLARSEAARRSSLCDSEHRCHARDSRAARFFEVPARNGPCGKSKKGGIAPALRPERCAWLGAYAAMALSVQPSNAGSPASKYSLRSRDTSSSTETMWVTLPMPWPEPQMSFHALGLVRSPESSVAKLIAALSEEASASGSRPAALIEGLR